MRIIFRVVVLGLLALIPLSARKPDDQPVASGGTHAIRLNGHTFTLPKDFSIELAAPVGLVPRPITADFDEQGRLYVADSSGSNEKVAEQLVKKPHRIVRLEDTRGTGTFDKMSVFADRMMFPEGTMWRDGSLYVAAPPSIWKLTDTDGDGVADVRTEWFQGKTLTGCANDLHGPYLGPDGWIYWCKGAFALQSYPRGPGKGERTTRASHIFRCRPDGSGLEAVMTGGMDNPVDVVFLPNGERVFTTTFFQHPGLGLRDGLIHAVYGGLYGKVHDVINDHIWTGPNVMPVLSHMGAAAPCGLVCYEGSSFGPDFRGNIFACQFNLRKVSRHVLKPDGSGYTARDEDFVVSDNLDFHPTDVVEDADGSLLIVDTGGWYKLCCPTSQLDKPDIHGAIYRVRRKDAPRVNDPRGAREKWDAPATLLGDPRPAVRDRAKALLARKGTAALGDLKVATGWNVEMRRNALWTLMRIDAPASRALIREALTDEDPSVQQVALHAISLWRDRDAVPELLRLLERGTPRNRRLAAEALGRIGERSAVPALLRATATAEDRPLEHALTYAMIELEAPAEIEAGLTSDNAKTLRATLVALDQLGKLNVRTVLKHLQTSDATVKENLLWIAGRHPEWGNDLASYLRTQLDVPEARDECRRLLSRFARAEAIQALIAEELRRADVPRARLAVTLHALTESGLKEAPELWTTALADLLATAEPEALPEIVQAIRSLTIPRSRVGKLQAALLAVGANRKAAAPLRLAALAAIPGGAGDLAPDLFDLARKYLDPEQPVRERALAVEICSRARLTSEQLLTLAEALRTVGPLEVDRLLEAFVQTTDERIGLALVAALAKSLAFGGLRIDMIRPRLAKFPANVREAAENLYRRIDADAAKQKEKLDQLLATFKDGDIRRGQAVFHNQKTACIACHALGYLGGRIGPDLTRIGTVRSERDLLESILFPSASLVRSYEPILVHTKAGKVHNGLIRRETPDEIELVVGAEQTLRIGRSEIEEIQPSKVSVMPAGLERILTTQDLADLLAFLKSRK